MIELVDDVFGEVFIRVKGEEEDGELPLIVPKLQHSAKLRGCDLRITCVVQQVARRIALKAELPRTFYHV